MINHVSEIPIEGITYKQLRIEKKPLTPEYVPPPPELVPAAKRAVCIDPSRTCMPFGAMWATLGVHRAIPFVQGAQGCTTYVRYTFSRVFREPASIATASFHEDAAVFGGRKNLIRGVRNLVCRYKPELIAIVTTCSSEVIGDDIQSFLAEAQDLMEEEFGPEVLDLTKFVVVNTPSFAGSHVEGYNRAAHEFLKALSRKSGQPSEDLYFIPGFLMPGDLRELKHIFELMGVSYHILFDISDTLDCPLVGMPNKIPYYPPGGTRVEEFVRAGDAKAIFALSPDAGGAGAKWLSRRHKVPAFVLPMPIGVGNTDQLLKTVSEVSGRSIPDSIRWERGILLDAMADTLHYTMMKRVAICGDPDFAAAATRFICELGMIPTYILVGTKSSSAAEEIWKVCEEYNYKPVIMNGSDQFEWEYALKNDKPDVILGHSRCVNISKEIRVPLVRFGFPVYGLSAVGASLRKVGEALGLSSDKVEDLIREEETRTFREIRSWLKLFSGKRVLVVLGAGRLGPLGRMLRELGFEVIGAASVFGSSEDHQEAAPFSGFLTDDPGDDEFERALSMFKPDLVITNAREQWRAVKLGFPTLSFPQERKRGPYTGYQGFVNFVYSLIRVLRAPVWRLKAL